MGRHGHQARADQHHRGDEHPGQGREVAAHGRDRLPRDGGQSGVGPSVHRESGAPGPQRREGGGNGRTQQDHHPPQQIGPEQTEFHRAEAKAPAARPQSRIVGAQVAQSDPAGGRRGHQVGCEDQRQVEQGQGSGLDAGREAGEIPHNVDQDQAEQRRRGDSPGLTDEAERPAQDGAETHRRAASAGDQVAERRRPKDQAQDAADHQAPGCGGARQRELRRRRSWCGGRGGGGGRLRQGEAHRDAHLRRLRLAVPELRAHVQAQGNFQRGGAEAPPCGRLGHHGAVVHIAIDGDGADHDGPPLDAFRLRPRRIGVHQLIGRWLPLPLGTDHRRRLACGQHSRGQHGQHQDPPAPLGRNRDPGSWRPGLATPRA